jgi:hypothetical protein
MLTKYVDKNKFGGYTWEIKFDPIFRIKIFETNDGSLLVEFKEFKWINYKTHFSFISRKTMEETIIEALELVFQHFLNRKDFNWTIAKKENVTEEVLKDLKLYTKEN